MHGLYFYISKKGRLIMRDYEESIAVKLREMGYAHAEPKEMEKANGVYKNAICLRKTLQDNVEPIIYTDEMYERKMSVDDAARKIDEIYRLQISSQNELSDVTSRIMNYEYVKEHIVLRLYHESNKADIFKSAKRYGFDDLILVPYVNVIGGAFRVEPKQLEILGVDKTTIFKDALRNTKADVIIRDLGSMFPFPGIIDTGMEVVSNKTTMFGASAIIGMLPKYKAKYPGGFYVIPSSMHEVIVVPKVNGVDTDNLNDLVDIVNKETLNPEDVLGHKAYLIEQHERR